MPVICHLSPELFEINNEKNIDDYLEVFDEIRLLMEEQEIEIIMYKTLYDKLLNRGKKLFPINVSVIENRENRIKIENYNNDYLKVIANRFKVRDIEQCAGNQDFTVIDNKSIQEKYYDFCSILLTNCYYINDKSNRIITNKHAKSFCVKKKIILKCQCDIKKENQIEFDCVLMSSLGTRKYRIIQELKKKLPTVKIYNDPIAKMDKHHNHVQRYKFKKLSDLGYESAKVLKKLREMGLYDIRFRGVERAIHGIVGEIYDCKLEEREQVDVIIGLFRSRMNLMVWVDLYFPVGIGKLIDEYLDHQLTLENVDKLLNRV